MYEKSTESFFYTHLVIGYLLKQERFLLVTLGYFIAGRDAMFFNFKKKTFSNCEVQSPFFIGTQLLIQWCCFVNERVHWFDLYTFEFVELSLFLDIYVVETLQIWLLEELVHRYCWRRPSLTGDHGWLTVIPRLSARFVGYEWVSNKSNLNRNNLARC